MQDITYRIYEPSTSMILYNIHHKIQNDTITLNNRINGLIEIFYHIIQDICKLKNELEEYALDDESIKKNAKTIKMSYLIFIPMFQYILQFGNYLQKYFKFFNLYHYLNDIIEMIDLFEIIFEKEFTNYLLKEYNTLKNHFFIRMKTN